MMLLKGFLVLAMIARHAVSQSNCKNFKLNTCLPESAAIKAFYNMNNASMCCTLCNQNSDCGSFTLNFHTHTCYLHPMGPTHFKHGNCTSSEVRAPKPPPPPPKNAKNVMFFISDDLRPEMFEAYGQKYMVTPNLDALAKKAMVFNRAYCQQAICGPTRNSFLSGRRPQRTKAWNFIDHFREEGVGANWTSFPGYFLQHGYTTLGGGKTYHPSLPPDNDGGKSWSMGDGVPSYVSFGDVGGCSRYWGYIAPSVLYTAPGIGGIQPLACDM